MAAEIFVDDSDSVWMPVGGDGDEPWIQFFEANGPIGTLVRVSVDPQASSLSIMVQRRSGVTDSVSREGLSVVRLTGNGLSAEFSGCTGTGWIRLTLEPEVSFQVAALEG